MHKNQLSSILSAIPQNDSILFRRISGVLFKIKLSGWILIGRKGWKCEFLTLHRIVGRTQTFCNQDIMLKYCRVLHYFGDSFIKMCGGFYTQLKYLTGFQSINSLRAFNKMLGK